MKFLKSKGIDDFRFVFVVPLSRYEGYKKLHDIVDLSNAKVKKMSREMKKIESTQFVVALDTNLYADILE